MALPPLLPGIVQNLCEPSFWSNLCRSSGCSETPTGLPLSPQGTLQYKAIIIKYQIAKGMIWMGDLLILLVPHFPSVLARESRALGNYKVHSSDCLPYSVSSPCTYCSTSNFSTCPLLHPLKTHPSNLI